MIKLIDSHCHLDFEPLSEDIGGAIERAGRAGVVKMINIGTSLPRSRKSVDLADKYPGIWASVGLHPQDVGEVHDLDSTISELRQLASSAKVVAIGEIGLDYYSAGTGKKAEISDGDKERQKKMFKAQLELASELRLPVIVHVRDAWDDFFETVTSHKSLVTRGVVHCFTGDAETAERLVNIGFYIGFTGIVTFGQSKFDHTREATKAVPLENILVETDAPFLTPEPHRGKTNEPAFVVEVAKKIAEIKELSFEEVSETTTKNAEKLFNMSS